jgi:UDP:flavonoid glycosyltransferase YjiC (YdhE family)
LCGFSRYDGQAIDAALKLDLETWLGAGEPPIIFTLGSSVSMYATDFFDTAIESARRLGHRALLITGQDPAQYDAAIASARIPLEAIRVFRYLPYSAVFPHAAVNVHQGGVGTLAQALAAGKPQLITPVGFDQPDNARRMARLGVALSIPFQKLEPDTLTAALRELLSFPRYRQNAAVLAGTVAAEEHAQRAAALLGG